MRHIMNHKTRSVQWRPSSEMYLRPCNELDSQYSLMIDRQGTSAQQHCSNSVNLIARKVFDGKKKARFFLGSKGSFSWPFSTSFMVKVKSHTGPDLFVREKVGVIGFKYHNFDEWLTWPLNDLNLVFDLHKVLSCES